MEEDIIKDLDGTELKVGDRVITHTLWGGESRGGLGLVRLYFSHVTGSGRLSLVPSENGIKGHPNYKYNYPYYRFPDQVLKLN